MPATVSEMTTGPPTAMTAVVLKLDDNQSVIPPGNAVGVTSSVGRPNAAADNASTGNAVAPSASTVVPVPICAPKVLATATEVA